MITRFIVNSYRFFDAGIALGRGKTAGRSLLAVLAWLLILAHPTYAQTCYVVGGSQQVDGSGQPSSGGPWTTFFAASQAAGDAECTAIGGTWCGGRVSCTNGGVPTGSAPPGACTITYPQGTYGIDGLGEGQAASGSACTASVQSSKDAGPAPAAAPETTTADPIVTSIGNKILSAVDYQAPGLNSLQFVRYYNSAAVASSAAVFAHGWMHNYGTSVNTISSTAVSVTRADGKAIPFNLVSGTWTPDADISDKLVELMSGSTVTGWQYTVAANDSLETYDQYGNLISIAYREGTTITLAYTSGTFQLSSATDSFGRTLTFGFSGGRLHTVTDPNGGVYTYTINSSTDTLTSVAYPDMYSTSYLYNESAYTGGQTLPYAMTGLIDENISRYSTTWYGAGGVAIQSQLAPGTSGNIGLYKLTNTLDSTGRIQSTSIVDPLGATRGRSFTTTVGRNRLTTVTQPAANGSPAATKSYTYDANGNMAKVADLDGNVTCAVYDLTRNLQTGRVEGMASGSTCPTSISTYVPASGTVQRKILTQWHSIWHLPVERSEPLRITTWVYNGDGGVYCAPSTAKVGANPIGVLCSMTIQPTTDATGGSGFGATFNGSSRTWSYTYNSFGQVLTAVGPRKNGFSDVTTYTYYTCTTGAQCGQVDTVNNQVGHITTYSNYNAHGQAQTITDPNGVVTTLKYDTRLRLTSKQVGSETTQYSYYPTGLLNLVTLPDGSTVQSFYDAAHRLYKTADGLGNYILYTLDAAGNHTVDNVYDSAGTVHRTHYRVFNALSELYQDINSANTSAVTTTYGYDGNGNVLSIDAPLSRNTSKLYDALNRVSQITDPMSGITKPSYDGRDNPAGVIDPRTLTTSYNYDGFGEITQLVSPDTGTTTYLYDSGGNIKTVTDARSAAANYSFDDANRLTKLAYSDQTITFTYDSGTYGIDRLTGASDANHSMTWAYDANGRVNSKSQTVASITRTVGYTYTNADLTQLVTPSGQTITYGYTNHQITSIKVGSTTLLSGVTYDPFGPATGWTWGNGTTTSKSFDLDGNPVQFVTAGVTNIYSVDNASRITKLTDGGLSSNTWNFTAYDLSDRIKTASSSAKSRGYTYDANGNVTAISGTTASTESVSTTNNQLSSTNGALVRTYSYDAAGNASYTGETLTFNKRGRMSVAVSGAGTTNYVYNAQEQLIEKSGNGGTTLLVYDEAGHTLGEYTSTGALIQETVWMGDTPVATIQPSGSSVVVYYIHTDHLDTPRKVTRPSDNGLMWRYDPDTYGASTTAANGNPAGLGAFVYNLRFPGQYYLSESGLSYNYHRTYDPQTGRYIESDPVGLIGGINTYAYVGGNPIGFSDSRGLSSTPPPSANKALLATTVAIPATNPFLEGLLAVLARVTVFLSALSLSGDTVQQQQPQYVVRGGLATPENLITGSGPVDDPYSNLNGFSVQSAPNMTVDQLAAAGNYGNSKISYTTVANLLDIGVSVAPTPFPWNQTHATVLVSDPLTPAQAARISATFQRIPNPSRRQ